MLKNNINILKKLDNKEFFKLVCGASLNDQKLIKYLAFIYAISGATVIDLAASADAILAARDGLENAKRYSDTEQTPLLMASIHLDKDPHFRKVKVDYSSCDVCGACIKICPTEAFSIESEKHLKYFIERCYGCNICPPVCHTNALTLIDTNPTPKETLKEMIDLGIRAIEFHFGNGYKKLEIIWDEIKDLVKKLDLISFSIGSDLLSEEEIILSAKLCHKLAGENIIIQCDGTPMSGSKRTRKIKNGNNNTKSCFEVAKIIQNLNLPVYLQISGGTDEHSFSQAYKMGLNIHGVAIGSYARELILPFMKDINNNEVLEKAISTGKTLVNSAKIKI